jgi:hypothetical protein
MAFAMPKVPAVDRECYTAAEVAAKLGIHVDNFYRPRVREDLHAHGMPRSVTGKTLRYPKRAFDAWLDRDHPLMPKAPELLREDAATEPETQETRDWRAYLHSHYSKQ